MERIYQFTSEYGSPSFLDIGAITHIVCLETQTRAYVISGDWVELPGDHPRLIDAWKIYLALEK